ncbi:MAG: hypothetical protein QM645_09505 [Asticcacaulis sp.]
MSEMSPRRFSQHELTLEDMLNDPIVQLLMTRDGVQADDVKALMANQARLLNAFTSGN